MGKEMNWLYVRKNYGKVFKETFGKESGAIKEIYTNYAEAIEMSDNELLESIKNIESEMVYLIDNFKVNIKVARQLYSWCFNMVDNLMWVLDNREGN